MIILRYAQTGEEIEERVQGGKDRGNNRRKWTNSEISYLSELNGEAAEDIYTFSHRLFRSRSKLDGIVLVLGPKTDSGL